MLTTEVFCLFLFLTYESMYCYVSAHHLELIKYAIVPCAEEKVLMFVVWVYCTCVRLQQLQEQHCPFLTVYGVFSCIQTKVWLPMLAIFNVHIDVIACNWTWRLYGPVRLREYTKSWLWEKNPLLHWGNKHASAVYQSTLCQLSYIPTPGIYVFPAKTKTWLLTFSLMLFGSHEKCEC